MTGAEDRDAGREASDGRLVGWSGVGARAGPQAVVPARRVLTPQEARAELQRRAEARAHGAKLELVRRYVNNGIRTEEELANFLWVAFQTRMPDTHTCEHHTTPWRVFADAYFARVPVTVVEGSRGLSGKSYSLALLGLTMALTIIGEDGMHPDVNVLGGSGEQSKRVLDYMVNWWDLPYMPRWALKSDPASRETKFIWGNTIKALMASQTSVRGPHPQKLLFDEIDEMEVGILDAALGQPMARHGIATTVVLSSTWHNPNGTMTDVKKRAKEKGWSSVSYCYRETLKPHGWLDPVDVETKRINMTAASFRNEVELQEPAPGSRAIATDKVDAMFRPELGVFAGDVDEYIEIEPPRASAFYATGADWAKEQDWTIIVTYRVDVFPARLVAFERRGRVDWPMMVKRLDERSVRYGTNTDRHRRAHDGTGLGDVIDDYLGYESEGVQMRGLARSDMLSNYIKAIEEGEVEAPKIEYMYEEHKMASVGDVYQTDKAHHLPDTIAAGALAWYAARQMIVDNRQAGAQSV